MTAPSGLWRIYKGEGGRGTYRVDWGMFVLCFVVSVSVAWFVARLRVDSDTEEQFEPIVVHEINSFNTDLCDLCVIVCARFL